MTESAEKITQAITTLHESHSDWDDKTIVAKAYENEKVTKDDFEDGFCPYKVLSRVRFIRGLEKAIYTADFTDTPTSIRISQAVNENLPKLKSDFPNVEEVEVLKMAYDMARGVLDNSDFETVEEEAIYFEIFVDDPMAFEAELQRQYIETLTADDFVDDNNELLKSHIFRIAKRNWMNNSEVFNALPSALQNEKAYQMAIRELIEEEKLEVEGGGDKQFKIRGITVGKIHAFDFTDDKAQAQFFAKDKPVSGSSNVAEIGYERGKLRIFFKNGGGYEYPVPSSWYTEMLNAPSKGSYVWDSLRGRVPGRVIDNPNKITPGGVGGSIVPYFKIKGAAMAPDAMRKSVGGFLKAARKGRAEVGGVPIRRIPKPEFKAFKRFLKKGVLKFTPEKEGKPKKAGKVRKFKRIAKKAAKKAGKGKKGKSKTTEDPVGPDDNSAVREQIKRLRKALKNARKAGLDNIIIQAMERRITQLEKSISDFITYYNITDDFTDDMKYFSGPITRAGEFLYNEGTKTKSYDNLTEVFSEVSHLPSFDSHNEDQILGFAYNFNGDPNTQQIFSEGYTFSDIEETAKVSLDSNTRLPVSIRFLDANEGTDVPEQHITDLIHLAISVNQTDTDRCSSAGGNPCYVQFQDKQDFNERKLEQVGDLMPPKKEEEEKKKPPKDKDEEEDKEEEKKKESSDQAKSDPPMDAEYQSEGKNMKDFDDTKFMKVPIEQWTSINKAISDMESRDKKRTAIVNKIELDKIKSDFKESEQLYRLNNDFVKNATLDQMQNLKEALVEHNPDVDAQSQLFNSDFSTELDNVKNKMKEMYGVKK